MTTTEPAAAHRVTLTAADKTAPKPRRHFRTIMFNPTPKIGDTVTTGDLTGTVTRIGAHFTEVDWT